MLVPIGSLIPLLARAGGGIFGTKLSPVQASGGNAPMGVFPVVQMLLALVVVLALVKWVMPLVFKKYSGRFTGSTGSAVRVLETTAAGAASLSLVAVKGRTLLVGSTPSSVVVLADFTAPEHEPKTFQEILESAPETSAPPGLSDLAGQLERLRRLGP